VSKIETGRYSELLRKQLGMKGQEVVAGELSPEISPTFQLEGPTAEWDFLKQVRLVSAAATEDPVVGQNPRFALINPSASGMIATVSQVRYTSSIASRLLLRFITVQLGLFANLAEAGPRDSRWGAPGTTISPITLTSETNAATIAGGFLIDDITFLANTFYSFNVPTVLAPGSSLFWGATSGNIRGSSSVHWSERRLPALEL